MRIDSPAFTDEVAGTTSGDTLEVNAWRGSALVATGLAVSAWSLGWDTTRQVQGQATFTVADPDGTLAPWSLADPLGPGGTRLQVTWVSGLSGLRVPLGWWRIRKADPAETWRLVTAPQAPAQVLRVAGGGSVQVQADEETATVVLSRLDAEVVTSPTVLAEVTRLLRDITGVKVLGGVADGPVPTALVYSDSRMDAVEDLLATVNATHRMGGDGTLEVVPMAGIGPVWTLAGGDLGVLVSLVRSLSDEGVYNAVTSTGEDAGGQPLVGRAFLTGGPLAWGGPFGKVPLFHQAVAKTPSGVLLDATTTLANRQGNGEVDLAVTCLAHPGVQPNDRVTLLAATVAGDAPITGRVVAMTLAAASSDSGTTPAKAMALAVRVASNDLEAIASRVRAQVAAR